jgi:hypothetical protein
MVEAMRPLLVILDAATDTFGGDEIRRREVRRYLRVTQRALAAWGPCVLHVLHVDKIAARGATTQDLYSGSTDWNNGARARLAFYRQHPLDATWDMDEEGGGYPPAADGPLRLELQKANYAKRGAFIDLRYDPAQHVFVQIGGSEAATAGDLVSSIRKQTDERSILQALAAAEDAGDPIFSAEQSHRNAAVRLKAAGTLPSSYRGRTGKRQLFTALLRLKSEGLLTEDMVTTAARHRAGIWRVSPAGRSLATGG